MEELSGIKIAKVLKNNDPLKMERCFCRVIGIHNIDDNFKDINYGIWIHNGNAKKSISADIPDIGDLLYIMFVNNDPMHAIYLGVVRSII